MQIKETTGCRMRIVEAVPGADERVVVISSPDDTSKDRIAAEVGVLLQVSCRLLLDIFTPMQSIKVVISSPDDTWKGSSRGGRFQ